MAEPLLPGYEDTSGPPDQAKQETVLNQEQPAFEIVASPGELFESLLQFGQFLR